MGVLFAGWERRTGPQLVYVASNAYWEPLEAELPALPSSMNWELAADTWEEQQQPRPLAGNRIQIRPRSVMIFVGR